MTSARANTQALLRRMPRRGSRRSVLDIGWDDKERAWREGAPVYLLLGALRQGSYMTVAAQLAGIPYWTVTKWMAAAQDLAYDDEGEPVPYDELGSLRDRQLVALHRHSSRAEVLAEHELVTAWRNAGAAGDWRAARDYLARKHPQRWGQQVKVEAVDGPELVEATDRILDRLLGEPDAAAE